MKTVTSASRNHVIRHVVFLGYVAIVLGATLAPISDDAYELASGFDKLIHVCLFGGVALLLCWNIARITIRWGIMVFLCTVAFAASIELIQATLWYRSGDLWDLLAGAVGALIGVAVSWFLSRHLSRA